MATASQQQLSDFLNQRILWSRAPAWGTIHTGWRHHAEFQSDARPSVEELARELVAHEEFQALQLGRWLGTPQGEFFAQAVESVMPPFYKQDAQLLVSALRLAAAMQRRQQRYAGAVALGAFVVFGLLIVGAGRETRG